MTPLLVPLLRFLCTGLLSFFALAAAGAAPLALQVSGTQLLTSDGQPIRLRGVNCAGMEWSADGEGHIRKTIEVAVTEWHANLIRLPLSQDRWFGKAPGQEGEGAGYRELVRELIEFCAAHDAYLMIDLHWSNAGEWGKNIGQHNLPDRHSVTFWTDVAATYRDHPAVLFDLYNEPTRCTWDQWLQGGPIVENDSEKKITLRYEAVGMQALVDAIRAAGAKNVIVAGGINWAYELEGIPGRRELVDREGHGIVYACHPYPHAYEHLGLETIAQWEARAAAFAQKLPLIVTEFGSIEKMWPFPKAWHYSDEIWNREMLRVLEARGWNWTAWDFHPTASPCLIADWSYTPTPHFGTWVKASLALNRTR